MASLKYDEIGDAWLGWLYHLAGCIVGLGQGLIHGLFRGSLDMRQYQGDESGAFSLTQPGPLFVTTCSGCMQRASTWAAFQKHAPGVLSNLYFVAGCVAGISQGVWFGVCQPNHPKNQRGSGRACPKTTRHGDTRDAPHVAAYSQTKQKLFAWFSSARSSGSAARPGAAAEAYSCTWLSYLYTSCSTFAAALAAHVSYKATGAGGSASSAAHAAKPNLVSGDGTDKSAKGSRSSSHPVPHRSTKDDKTSGSPDELLMHQAQELFDLGIQALDQADFVRALDLCNDALKLNTADYKLTARLHHNKGCALVELRQYALAIVECCKAIDLDKDMWRPYIVRHLAWRHVGLYTKAAEDLAVAQAKSAPRKQHFIRDVAKPDSMRCSALLGLGNNGKPLRKHHVKVAYRGLMRECHPDTARDDQRHQHQRHVANMLAQHLNFARDKLQASL